MTKEEFLQAVDGICCGDCSFCNYDACESRRLEYIKKICLLLIGENEKKSNPFNGDYVIGNKDGRNELRQELRDIVQGKAIDSLTDRLIILVKN